MPAIITTDLRVFAAEQFISSFSAPDTNVYVFIGASTPWDNDSVPPAPVDCVSIQSDSYRSMMSLKRVNPSDVVLAIPRYSWSTGVYSQYTQLADIRSPLVGTPPFYTVTSDLNVYICLYNNGGAPSTVAPNTVSNSTSAYPFTTADGYTWKYMYTVSSADAVKFVSNLWIPVQTLTANDSGAHGNQWNVQQGAVGGAIDRIDIVANGTQYSVAPLVAVVGDGVGAAAYATVVGGNVTGIAVTASGSGYTYANVVFTGGGIGANGASAQAIIAPFAGHGADAVAELGGRFALVNPSLIFDENGTFTVANDYRRIGLLLNPVLWGASSNLATASDYTQAISLTFSSITGGPFVADDTVTGLTSGATGVVMDYAGNVLRLTQITGAFQAGELVQNSTVTATGALQIYTANAVSATSTTVVLPSSANTTDNFYTGMTATVTSGTGHGQTRVIAGYVGSTRTVAVAPWATTPDSTSAIAIANIQYPAIQPFSGKVIYVENRSPISRAANQTEVIKMVIEF